MLIKGSSRDIPDKQGRLPIDMIGNIAHFQRVELEQILGRQPINFPCSQTKVPLIKLRKNYSVFMIYVCLMISTFIELHLYVYPYKGFKEYSMYLYVHFIVVNILFLMASFKDPGKVDKNPSLNFEKLVEKLDPNSLCPNCETMYTRDSRHCYICN